MRRVHLRGRLNVLKRYLVHVAAFNLGILMRTIFGVGAPKGLQGRLLAFAATSGDVWAHLIAVALAWTHRQLLNVEPISAARAA